MKTKKAKKEIQIKSNKTEPLTIYKKEEFEEYKRWKLSRMAGLLNQTVMERLGIDDAFLADHIAIKSQRQYAEKHNLDPVTLVNWNLLVEKSDDLQNLKQSVKKLTPLMLMSVFRHGMQKQGFQDRQFWFKLVEEWKEMIGIGVVGKIEHTISEEDKKALDKLLKENAH